MTIIEFGTFIEESRKEFRELIEKYLNGEVEEKRICRRNSVCIWMS